MVLLWPAGLLALVALAVPLLLHLRRATEARRVEFAALRWLSPRQRPRRRLRVREWLLLLLRLLLAALVALLFAGPARAAGLAAGCALALARARPAASRGQRSCCARHGHCARQPVARGRCARAGG